MTSISIKPKTTGILNVPITTIEKFAKKIEIDKLTECWNWRGSLSPEGYGLHSFKHNNHWFHKRTHRISLELATGRDISVDGLIIDHLCRNKTCCNPKHLELVTYRENLIRSDNPLAILARKTHCKQNHKLSDANLYVTKKGYRQCVTCKIDRTRKWRLRKKEQA